MNVFAPMKKYVQMGVYFTMEILANAYNKFVFLFAHLNTNSTEYIIQINTQYGSSPL